MVLTLSAVLERPLDRANLPVVVAVCSMVLFLGSILLLPLLVSSFFSDGLKKLLCALLLRKLC